METFVVEETSLGVDLVRERLEVDGRGRDLLLGGVVTVSQVTTRGETETHDSVLGLEQSGKGSKVGSGSRVWLDVATPDLGVEVEGLESSVSAEVLELVDVLVTTVVSCAWETFRVLVGEHGAVGFHNSQGGQVLGSNELEAGELSVRLIFDDLVDLWVGLGQGLVQALVLQRQQEEGALSMGL